MGSFGTALGRTREGPLELLGEGAAHDFSNVLDLLLRQSPQRLLEPPGRQAEEVNKSFLIFHGGSMK